MRTMEGWASRAAAEPSRVTKANDQPEVVAPPPESKY
jgi:hypothetical protein